MPKNPPWPRITSSLCYDDAAAAIDFLCRAFGFEVRLRVDGANGYIEHSELMLGDGLIMVGSPRPTHPSRQSPRSLGGANTQALMVHVEDIETHVTRARAAGAKILQEPKTTDYGEKYWADRSYEAEDPEGHRWWFSQRMRDRKS